MKFAQNNGEIILNDGLRLTVEQFKMLEPTYPELPSGYTHRLYIPGEVHEISGGGSVISEPTQWTSGDRYIKRISEFEKLKELLDFEGREIAESVENARKKKMPYATARKEEYPKIEDMVVTMWEYLVKQKRSNAAMKEMENQRVVVKNKYPKN